MCGVMSPCLDSVGLIYFYSSFNFRNCFFFFLSFFWFVLVCVSLLKYKSFIQSQSQHFITSYIQLGLAFILLLLLSFHPPFMFVFILFFHFFFYRYRKLCTLKHVLFLLHKISILYLLNSTLPSLLLSQRL